MHPKIKIAALLLGLIGVKNILRFQIYNGGILAFDQDDDQRLVEVAEYIYNNYNEQIFAIHEEDGGLALIWENEIPDELRAGQSIPTTYPDGSIDNWFIGFSSNKEAIKWNNTSQFIAQAPSFSNN